MKSNKRKCNNTSIFHFTSTKICRLIKHDKAKDSSYLRVAIKKSFFLMTAKKAPQISSKKETNNIILVARCSKNPSKWGKFYDSHCFSRNLRFRPFLSEHWHAKCSKQRLFSSSYEDKRNAPSCSHVSGFRGCSNHRCMK